VTSRKAAREALTGAHAGRVLSRVILKNQSADVVPKGGRQRDLPREPTYPKRMDDNGHWALLPWKTKSSNKQWEQSLGRSTKRTFWDSRTGSGLGEASTLRWMRYGSGL
jgi:hypothetical protein